MENLKNNASESSVNKLEKLSGKEKFEAILALFGTETAREAFVQTCRNYIEARMRAVRESYSPEVSIRRRAITSSPKQAVIHNKIMDTLTRLASQAPIISPLQSEVLREMHNRDVTAEIIKEYFAPKENVLSSTKVAEEDEEAGGGKRKGMSDTAYYHSLGKEH